MSVGCRATRQSRLRLVGLGVKPGDVVVVWEHPELVNSDSDAWYLAEVLCCEGGARDADSASRLQVADVETGALRWCHSDCVERVLISVTHPVTGF